MIWLFTFFMSWAQAGYLQIVDESNFRLQRHAQGLLLTGEFQISNQGDETARQVYPEMDLENFVWNGDPRDLDAGETKTWKVEEVIPANKLVLPLKGQFAFSLFKHYQDTNGYPFAIPGVKVVAFQDSGASNSPQIRLNISANESNHFTAQVEIQNGSKAKKNFYPQLLLPREVDLGSPIFPLEVEPQTTMETTYQFFNHKGLIGSTYHTFFILTWVERGERKATIEAGSFQISKPQGPKEIWGLEKTFWAWWGWALAVGFIGMWAFWLRPLHRFAKR